MMKGKSFLLTVSWVLFIFSCHQDKVNNQVEPISNPVVKKVVQPEPPTSLGEFPRDDIKTRIDQKIQDKDDLFVHVLVPLCDNEHQGIVPVSKSLGDGFNPRTNLYWGALYGIKTHLKKHKDWTLIYSEKDIDNEGIILERVVFKKSLGGRNIYITADAYRGDKMKECLLDYMNALAGVAQETLTIDEQKINISGNADLIFFNGHNGLMDMDVPIIENKDGIKKDAIAVACASHGFFTRKLEYAGGYPLLMTTNLLAPEAYVLENVISEWAKGTEGVSVADAAGRAYNEYQNCGYKGARRLFKSGW